MDITHYIISTTGKHYGITERTEKQLTLAGLNDMVEVSQGVKIKVSAIMELLPKAEYQNIYPEKITYDHRDQYKALPGVGTDGIVNRSSKRGLEIMIKTLQEYGKGHKCFPIKGKCGMREQLIVMLKAQKGHTKKSGTYNPTHTLIKNEATGEIERVALTK